MAVSIPQDESAPLYTRNTHKYNGVEVDVTIQYDDPDSGEPLVSRKDLAVAAHGKYWSRARGEIDQAMQQEFGEVGWKEASEEQVAEFLEQREWRDLTISAANPSGSLVDAEALADSIAGLPKGQRDRVISKLAEKMGITEEQAMEMFS